MHYSLTRVHIVMLDCIHDELYDTAGLSFEILWSKVTCNLLTSQHVHRCLCDGSPCSKPDSKDETQYTGLNKLHEDYWEIRFISYMSQPLFGLSQLRKCED